MAMVSEVSKYYVSKQSSDREPLYVVTPSLVAWWLVVAGGVLFMLFVLDAVYAVYLRIHPPTANAPPHKSPRRRQLSAEPNNYGAIHDIMTGMKKSLTAEIFESADTCCYNPLEMLPTSLGITDTGKSLQAFGVR